jgi:hypothetical protein
MNYDEFARAVQSAWKAYEASAARAKRVESV